jgi:peptidoglycan hydrolase-like protein with peptidoglycan-binding domain
LCFTLAAFSATKKQSPASKTSKQSQSAAASSKAAPAKKRASSKASKRAPARSRAARQTWRSGQQAPTPDRYREIQQALIDKGYFEGPATGIWGPQSVEALKRFQGGQQLEPNGKLDALTLITLGLGPKREQTSGVAGDGASFYPSGGGDALTRNREPLPTTDPN